MRPRSKLALILAFVLLAGVAPRSGGPDTPVLLGSFSPTGMPRAFGGLSGLEMSANGSRAVLISDRARLFEVTVTRENELITGLDILTNSRLLRPNGREFPGITGDSEGLAQVKPGVYLISFEADARVIRYSLHGTKAEARPAHPQFASLHINSALEALAVSADSTVYTLPEDTNDGTGPFPVFRLNGDTWDQPFAISRDKTYLPVGADFGPDGAFYLLERRFRGLFGFESRIRRFHINGDEISDGETLLVTPPGRHGNLEGISLWRDQHGRTRITMVADDNFFPFQRSEIVEYLLP